MSAARGDIAARAPATGSATYRGYVLALLVAVGVCGWVDRNILAVLLESIKRDLELSDTALGLLGGVSFGIFYAGVGLPVAWLADRCNRRSLIALSLGLWSVMTALCGLATSFGTLFVARIGVGIGEAGGSPPSQSLLCDYFPPERRAFALGVLYVFVPLGFVIGFASGGWLDETFGWQAAFLIVGLPGVALAALVRLTLDEPVRGGLDPQRSAERAPSLLATLRYFVTRPTMRHLSLAGAVHGIGAFSAALWLPSYFMRVFDVGSAEAGLWMALAYGVGGGAGVLSGGWFADRLAARSGDARCYPWACACVLLLCVPLTFAVYLAPSSQVAVAALVVAAFLGHTFLGPVTAMMQNLAGVRRRAVAAAVYLFLVNLVSMGLGPVTVGYLSDRFTPLLGDDALRFSLLAIVTLTSIWAAAHFALAARTIRSDLALARGSAIGPS
jgi:predicted MFS family arabinose efflux permease